MEMLIESLSGLGDFAIYFLISIVLLFVFKVVYTFVTPHNEWQLVKDDQNTAAAIGFGGALVGFCLALNSASSNSESLLDFVIWGLVAILAQSLAFYLLRFTFMPKIAERIANNEVSAGIMLGAMSISVGLLNAASMTY